MSTKGENRFDSTEASPWMRPFVPRRFLSNGHLQTIRRQLSAAHVFVARAGNSSSSRLRRPPQLAQRVSCSATAIGNPPRSAANG